MTLSGGTGTHVWQGATYCISGTITGRTFRGRYSQPTYSDPRFRSGNVEFTLAPYGNWTGTWTDTNNQPSRSWNGTCIGP